MRCRWLPILLGWFALSSCGGPSVPATAEGPSVPAKAERPNDLTGSELRDYDGHLANLPSPCGKEMSLGACVENPGTCGVCLSAARFVAGSIRAGFVTQEVEARYLARFDPDLVQKIDVGQAPTLGPANAVVTLVEFADYQCPFCAATVPLVDELVKLFDPHVRVVFFDFPLVHHPNARQAARAGVAAHRQGKFWDLHHIMFSRAERLEKADIEQYARGLNLNMQQFREDWDSEATRVRVQASYDLGLKLGVHGVPALFINGRAFDTGLFDLDGDDLSSWIETEIEIATGKPFER